MPSRRPSFALPVAGLILILGGFLLWRFAPGADRLLLDGLRLERAGPWVEPIRLFTLTGGLAFLAGLALVVAAGLALRGEGGRALWLVATVAGGRLAVETAKWLLGRDRPPLVDQLATVSSHSFPSAHAAGTLTVWLALAMLFPARRNIMLPLALAMAATIGWSRIALGVHWPSDVVGGFGLALLWTGLAWPWLPPPKGLSRGEG